MARSRKRVNTTNEPLHGSSGSIPRHDATGYDDLSELSPDDGLYLSDVLYYNQEELVRRYAPHFEPVDDDYGHDDQFPEELDEDDLQGYYEPFE